MFFLSSLLYSKEIWVTFTQQIKPLESFQQKNRRYIKQIRWKSDIKVFSKANFRLIKAMIALSLLRGSGNIVHLSDERITKQMFYGEPVLGRRSRHKLNKRYKDYVKVETESKDITLCGEVKLVNR